MMAGAYGGTFDIQHPGTPYVGVEGMVQFQISATGTVSGSLVEMDTFDAFGNITNVPKTAWPVTGTINSQRFSLSITLPEGVRTVSGAMQDINGNGTILFGGVTCDLHFGIQR
jgi:hypothetical protein